MNQKNFDYLDKQIFYTGFGDGHSGTLKEKMMEGKPAFEIPVLFTSTSIFPNFSVAAFTPVSISFESVTSYFGYPPGKVVHNFK